MKKKTLTAILATAMALIFSTLLFTGCAGSTANSSSAELSAEGGVINLKVNPEIAISYDADGKVTEIKAKNDDAKKIIESYKDYEGKECRTVVSELVTAIGEAGYLAEEIEGENRQITIEIESGSKLPNKTFLDEIVTDVRESVNKNDWKAPVDVKGESDYGITDYVDTDYGTGNDGITDYDATDYGNTTATTKPKATQATKATSKTTKNNTDYDDTDYGPNNDGVTDYDDTDYGPNNDGVTDYNDTDYGPNNDGVTDYNDTDYGPNNDGVTDYNDTDYGPNNDGVTDYNDSNTNYDDSNTNYDDNNTNYDDNNSDYDD